MKVQQLDTIVKFIISLYQIYYNTLVQYIIIMTSFLNIFGKAEKTKKDFKQEEVYSQVKAALLKTCSICNAQSAQKITFGEGVQPTLTCKRCELKAVNNETEKLAHNLLTIDKFSQSLAKQVKQYYSERANPNNISKLNAGQVVEATKGAESLINQIKEAYKKFQAKTIQKLSQLSTVSNSCNKISIFDTVTKLSQQKKLESIGNGSILLKQSVVINGLHFFDASEIQQDNKRIIKRQDKCEEISQIDLQPLEELIRHIDKITL